MKKILFIDRDGTIIVEPPKDKQVDSFEKLAFCPKAISNLYRITSELDYDLVMVTNQDGLGTKSFFEKKFWPPHNKMMNILAGEGVTFADVLIDRSWPKDKAPTRKPRTGLLTKYLNGRYDLKNSFVIGDRLTDVVLAKNIGAKGILITHGKKRIDQKKITKEGLRDILALKAENWEKVYAYLAAPDRKARVGRKTTETNISVSINLDGRGKTNIKTGLGFFDHMLEQLGKHSGIDLTVKVAGDLHIDEHHTVEDTALAIGGAFREALGKKMGIERYGFLLPMDDALAQVAVDFSGRSWLVWKAEFKREKIGDMPTELFYHFFKSFADASGCNLNIKAEGTIEHHKIEAIFKSVAKAIKMAIRRDKSNLKVPSTKGKL